MQVVLFGNPVSCEKNIAILLPPLPVAIFIFSGYGLILNTCPPCPLSGGRGKNSKKNLNNIHKVAQRLAERSGLYYEQIMSWFCVDGLGFGEIANAIKASEKLEGSSSVAEILAMKEELGGWGKVKQELGLIGKNKNTQPDDEPTIQNDNGNHGNGKDKDKNKNK